VAGIDADGAFRWVHADRLRRRSALKGNGGLSDSDMPHSRAPRARQPDEMDKMKAGELFDATAPEIRAEQKATAAWLVRYNASLGLPPEARRSLLLERFAEVGEGAVARPPFHCDYGFTSTSDPKLF
jgi:hypothetical protein